MAGLGKGVHLTFWMNLHLSPLHKDHTKSGLRAASIYRYTLFFLHKILLQYRMHSQYLCGGGGKFCKELTSV